MCLQWVHQGCPELPLLGSWPVSPPSGQWVERPGAHGSAGQRPEVHPEALCRQDTHLCDTALPRTFLSPPKSVLFLPHTTTHLEPAWFGLLRSPLSGAIHCFHLSEKEYQGWEQGEDWHRDTRVGSLSSRSPQSQASTLGPAQAMSLCEEGPFSPQGQPEVSVGQVSGFSASRSAEQTTRLLHLGGDAG